jgi:hypothetical protein
MKPSSKSKKEDQWVNLSYKNEYIISGNSSEFPVIALMNKRTGEVRFFHAIKVKEMGLENVDLTNN